MRDACRVPQTPPQPLPCEERGFRPLVSESPSPRRGGVGEGFATTRTLNEVHRNAFAIRRNATSEYPAAFGEIAAETSSITA